jgi:hypothetical protein
VVTGELPGIVGEGIGALFSSALVFVLIRWHRNWVFANARLQRLLARRLPDSMRIPFFWTYEYSWALIFLGEVIASLVAALLWLPFFGGMLMAIRGQPGWLSPPTVRPSGGPGPNAFGQVFFTVAGVMLLGLSLYFIVERERCARFARWLYDTTTPMDSPPSDRDLIVGPLHWGWLLYVASVGAIAGASGFLFVTAAFGIFR